MASCLGKNSKFLVSLAKLQTQVVKRPVEGQIRGYVDRRGDEDIRWQWAVRESPCQLCHQLKSRRGWVAKIFNKKQEDQLTNRHKEIKYVPKFWELEYYDYLLPDCCDSKKLSPKMFRGRPAVCGSENYECKGKQILVSLNKNEDLKECTEKIKIPLKEQFCLNEVCGKKKPLWKKKGSVNIKNEFLCLNNLVENKIPANIKKKNSNDCN